MIDFSMALRILIITLFLISAVVSLYAVKRRPQSYQLWGIAAWCIHVMLFTGVAALCSIGILTIDHNWLNMWSNTVRLHGGFVCLTTAIYYAARPR